MDIYDFALVGAASMVFSAAFGFLFRYIFEFRRDRRINALEDSFESLAMTIRAYKSQEKQAEAKEMSKEGMEALAKIWSSEGTKEEKIQASLPLVLANPALMKQGMKLIGKL